MGLKGNLNDISLENIFQMLFVERKGGLLSIWHGARKAEVFLKKGRISFARITEPGEGRRVKLAVIQNGYLTEQQWGEIIGVGISPTIDNILSDLAIHIDRDLLSFLFLREMKYTFFSLLQWSEGLYEYSPGGRPGIDEKLWKSLEGEHVLLEALREVEHWRGVQAKLPALNSSVVMVRNLLSVASDVRYTLTPDESYLASLASEQINLEDLLNSSKLSYGETGKIIEKFMSHRLLRVKRALKEVAVVDVKPSATPGNRWAEFVVLFLLIICLLAISDATFFDNSMRKSLHYFLSNEPLEPIIVSDEDFKKNKDAQNKTMSAGKSADSKGTTSQKGMEMEDSGGQGRSQSKSDFFVEGSQTEVGDRESASSSSGEVLERGVDELLHRAKAGDVDAQLSLGFLYDFGRGEIEEDDIKAAVWYRRAAEEGFHPEAQFNLGVMYKNGEGVKQDAVEAAWWYRKAASQGNSQARYNLALMYLEGDGLEPDKEKAIALLYRAGVSFWKEGNEKAVIQVVNVFKKIDPDSSEAKKLLLKTQEQN